MWRNHGASADSFYQVRPECADDVPETKFRIKVGKTLSSRRWHASFTPEGYLDIGKILSRICRGGIHPSIRGEVWEFLLGCYDSKSTFEEREQLRQRRRVQYAALKEECRVMFPLIGSGRFISAPVITEDGDPILDPIVLQELNAAKEPTSVGQVGLSDGFEMVKEHDKKVIQWKLSLHQIGLDVIRTDRTLVFYEKQEHLSKLWDILAVYAWFDKEVSYCQGMSDLCSPMIILLDDEADAFWCFERMMKKLYDAMLLGLFKNVAALVSDSSKIHYFWRIRRAPIDNFEELETIALMMRKNFRATGNSVGVEAQLSNLASITQVIDPKLHQHLETLGGGNYVFAFRMLMVLFRREFSFADSLYLWEMMWSLEYDPELFFMYEDPDLTAENSGRAKVKSIRQYGKYERENMRSGGKDAVAPLPISVFLVASVLKDKSAKLTEARGLDEVVKILNNITGNLDARKACSSAMKLQKKYLKKAANTNR